MSVEPLLERESELVALVEAVEAARVGAGSFVFVAGEAGIGKTALVRALRARLGGGVAVGFMRAPVGGARSGRRHGTRR